MKKNDTIKSGCVGCPYYDDESERCFYIDREVLISPPCFAGDDEWDEEE